MKKTETEAAIKEALWDFRSGIASVLALRKDVISGEISSDELADALGNIVDELLVLPMWLEPFDGLAIKQAFKAAFKRMELIKEQEAAT